MMLQEAISPSAAELAGSDGFALSAAAREYIDAIAADIAALAAPQLLAVLRRLQQAYRDFPELELQRPRRDLRESLQSAVSNASAADIVDLLPVIVAFDRTAATTAADESVADLPRMLPDLVKAERVVPRSASRAGKYRNGRTSRDALLAIAVQLESIRTQQPPRPRPDFGWPSGRLSFTEFLLQWPCEAALGDNPDDSAFIETAHHAILLRAPTSLETEQYLKLLRAERIDRRWIIEDLLGSQELRSLERRVRVVWRGEMITEPAAAQTQFLPVVHWPPRTAT